MFMKPLFLFAFMIGYGSINAQVQVVDVNKSNYEAGNYLRVISGEPIVSVKFVNLKEGSPYFIDEWFKSSIVLQDGSTLKNVPAKLNLLENQVHYLDGKELERVATSPIKEIVLYDEARDELYRFVIAESISAEASKGWYLWLSTGRASLYKGLKKKLTEQKPYGSATTEQFINTRETYFILFENRWIPVTKITQVPSLLPNKKAELEAFIKTQRSNGSMDDRMIELIAYYNTLLH